MNKEQLIMAIRSVNHSVRREFLDGFQEADLEKYLRRLTNLLGHRGPESIWVRDGDTHAVVCNAA
jgi:hypothetical protein